MTTFRRTASFGGLILAALGLVPLGFIAGDFNMKEWQVLGASMIALGAACLTYSAAMAKVYHDLSVPSPM